MKRKCVNFRLMEKKKKSLNTMRIRKVVGLKATEHQWLANEAEITILT